MAETDLTTWLPIADAARALGCSTRTVERLGRAKQLEQRLRRQEGTPPVAVYNPEDVARVASARRREPAPFVLPAGTGNGSEHRTDVAKLHQQNANSAEELIRQFFGLAVQALQSPPSPSVSASVAETLFLTLDQAAAVSGLSRTYLRRLITDKTLNAVKDRGWKIRRRDLEAL